MWPSRLHPFFYAARELQLKEQFGIGLGSLDMIILEPKETNILKGPLWLAQLQIPRFLFKVMKVMGTTCVGMDRRCNWKGQFENWSWPRIPCQIPATLSAARFSRTILHVPKKKLTLNLKN